MNNRNNDKYTIVRQLIATRFFSFKNKELSIIKHDSCAIKTSYTAAEEHQRVNRVNYPKIADSIITKPHALEYWLNTVNTCITIPAQCGKYLHYSTGSIR